ncbi:lysylphosphatidylglycerol synthase domain-containing protein [Actinophytocola gossypii]|uniref:Flippase-like domain-containing protein n=1 Tax=Actinophytocola gossypii TaxID=2812003 RepID=A0ABT2JFN6_9PSEU|nr:lysylphosphatidylglycerol synthase domain-containing protein [Actinophytocola gossypii]MCT2586686.1 flippase-like domain-containing protein [Actinophytocola gossypii]
MTEATDPGAAAAEPAARGRRAVVVKWLRRVLVLAVLAGAIYQLVVQWPDVQDTLTSLPWTSVALSFASVFAAIGLGPVIWHAVLRDAGGQVAIRDASMIYLVGQLGKYVPGSVWAFLVQMELAKAVGVTRVRAFTASIVTAGLGVVASLLTGALALPSILAGHQEYLWLFVLLPAGLVLLHPKPLTWIVSRGLRTLRRPPLERPLTAPAILLALGLSAGTYVLLGLHLWLLSTAIGPIGFDGLLLCIGAMSLAMTAGLLAFFLPSGIGAREVVIVAVLATVLPSGPAFTLAVVSRLMFTIVDLASAGGAALYVRMRRTETAPVT